MAQFIPGLDLNRHFFQQVIKPLMDEHFPGLRYSAGVLGEGSDVLRYDNPQSMDHNWGPHMRIFLSQHDYDKKHESISDMFRHKLPFEFMGFPTNYTKPADTYLVQPMKPTNRHPINHMIHFYTIRSFGQYYLGINPYKRLSYKDWLSLPQQALLEMTAGEVYFDGLNELEKIREKFKYYPDDVWLYMYQIEWGYVGGIEAFMGRSGEVGDELGSSVIASQIVYYIMRLCFLLEKTYWPYAKWFGNAFSRLHSARELTGVLTNAVHGKNWRDREDALGIAYEIVAHKHNETHITKTMSVQATEFEGRPYKVLHAMEFYNEIGKKLAPQFKKLKYKLGSIDQFIQHSKINHMNYVANKLRKVIA